MDAALGQEKENGAQVLAGGRQQSGSLLSVNSRDGKPIRAPLLTLDVRRTPAVHNSAWNPVSCPSRLQCSPQRAGSGTFDPFASAQEEPPGCTPMCGPQAAQAPAPPAVQRKPLPEDSPVLPAVPPAVRMAAHIQSCPPERVGMRGSRPLLRVRVKRSLNGAVAAAAGPPLVNRRSMDLSGAANALANAPVQQLAGCSRKRIEAELLSPPMPRKSSRTQDDQQAADLLARLQLAQPGPKQQQQQPAAAAAVAAMPAAGPIAVGMDVMG